MEKVEKILDKIEITNIIESIVLIALSIILYKFVTYLLTKGENSEKFPKGKQSKTYIRLMKNIIRNVFVIVTILILLQINGVNVSSILAGIGIVSVVIGLAIQDWLKDIIRGSTILSDHYFAVGDIIKYGGIEGQVVVIGLKTTKIRDIITGNFVCIANRNIEKVEIVSNATFVTVPMPYEIKVEKAEKVIGDIMDDILKNVSDVKDVKYLGVKELGESSINYLIQIDAKSSMKRQVNRDALRCVLVQMSKHNIDVPYNQIDVHQK